MTIEEIRYHLKETGKNLTDEEITQFHSMLKTLASEWLDKAEINIYGKTIRQLSIDNG